MNIFICYDTNQRKYFSKNVDKLCEIYNRKRNVIQSYLRKGYNLGWCSTYMDGSKKYTHDIIGAKRSKQVNILKNDVIIYSFKSMTYCAEQMGEIYNSSFYVSDISKCCNNKRDSYKGFQFKFA